MLLLPPFYKMSWKQQFSLNPKSELSSLAAVVIWISNQSSLRNCKDLTSKTKDVNLKVKDQDQGQYKCSRRDQVTAQRQPSLATHTRANPVQALSDGVHKALSGLAASYITELCIPVASIRPRSSLRSAAHGILFVPRTNLELGKRAFAVAGPASWNKLPDSVRSSDGAHQHVTCLNSVWRLISSDNHITYSLVSVDACELRPPCFL